MIKTVNLSIYRGDTHLFKVDLSSNGQPLDLADTVFVMDIKADDGSVLRPELSVEGSALLMLFPAAATAAIEWRAAEYDLRSVSGDVVKTYLRGRVSVSPSISQVSLSDGGGIYRTESVAVDVAGQALIVQRSESGGSQAPSDLSHRIEALELGLAGLAGKQHGLIGDVGAVGAGLASVQAVVEVLQSKVLDADESAEIEQLRQSLSDSVAAVAAVQARIGQFDAQIAAADESAEIERLKQEMAAANEQKQAQIAALQKTVQDLQDELGYDEYQSGYVAREDFAFTPGNNILGFIPFPEPFSRRPDLFSVTLDIPGATPRHHYINKVTPEGFYISTNYAPDLGGVWYIAGVKKA